MIVEDTESGNYNALTSQFLLVSLGTIVSGMQGLPGTKGVEQSTKVSETCVIAYTRGRYQEEYTQSVLDLDDCMAMHRQEHGMNQYG
jgi:hypothetical protein